jgi:Ala-tRNA(Pro) deacylase
VGAHSPGTLLAVKDIIDSSLFGGKGKIKVGSNKRGKSSMALLSKLKEILDENKVSYEVFNHALAYTAQEIAAKQHCSGNEMAKVVMLELDDALIMGVIPASRKISLSTVAKSVGAKTARLAMEDEFIGRFPDCEIGAMPPFGNLFDVAVLVDPLLEKDKYIYFNAGNHIQTVRMRYKDFARIVRPKVIPLVDIASKKAA